MVQLQREILGNLRKYGSLKELIKEKGFLSLLDFIVTGVIHKTLKRTYRPLRNNYGLSESLFCPQPVNQFERYARVINEIRQMDADTISVLEVGAGGEGLSFFSSILKKKCNFFLVDINKQVSGDFKRKQAVICDGCRLPFKNKAFDVTVLADVLEHVPKINRPTFYVELKRVCKKKLIVTCPLQSDDGMFQGKKYDVTFQHFFEIAYGRKEPNTAEHISANHPTLSEINENLPGSTVYGYWNCNLWLKYMLFSNKPLMGLFSGVFYYLFWKKDANKPPYWGGIITLNFTNHLADSSKAENTVISTSVELPTDFVLEK
jgi:hypothetical protein